MPTVLSSRLPCVFGRGIKATSAGPRGSRAARARARTGAAKGKRELFARQFAHANALTRSHGMENGSGLKTDQRQHGKNRETKRATAAAVYCAQAASLPQAACPSPRHQRFRRYSGGSITGGVQVAVPERARAKRRASMRRFSAARSRGTVRFASATLTPGLRRRGGMGGRAMMLPPYGGIFAASRLLDLLRLCVMCVCVLSARACSGGKAGRLAKRGGGRCSAPARATLRLRLRQLCPCWRHGYKCRASALAVCSLAPAHLLSLSRRGPILLLSCLPFPLPAAGCP